MRHFPIIGLALLVPALSAKAMGPCYHVGTLAPGPSFHPGPPAARDKTKTRQRTKSPVCFEVERDRVAVHREDSVMFYYGDEAEKVVKALRATNVPEYSRFTPILVVDYKVSPGQALYLASSAIGNWKEAVRLDWHPTSGTWRTVLPQSMKDLSAFKVLVGPWSDQKTVPVDNLKWEKGPYHWLQYGQARFDQDRQSATYYWEPEF